MGLGMSLKMVDLDRFPRQERGKEKKGENNGSPREENRSLYAPTPQPPPHRQIISYSKAVEKANYPRLRSKSLQTTS